MGTKGNEIASLCREKGGGGFRAGKRSKRSKKRSGSYEGGKGNERLGTILRVTSSTYFRVNDNYCSADMPT